MKVYYLFDPLCGWCYGAKPALETVASQYPVELVPTGLFYRSGRVMDADFAQYAWGNDQRIQRLTGQPLAPLIVKMYYKAVGNLIHKTAYWL